MSTETYPSDWAALDARPCPAWFGEARFGLFIHWGVYSVPAWSAKGTYAEWYWHAMNDGNSPTHSFHRRAYGPSFRYQDFAPSFKAELFDPDAWARLFVRAGARYVVLTAKHHDGFCLWPSAQSWNWNSADVGPHRDLVGDLSRAVRACGLKMGLYYSLYEWFHPYYLADTPRYVAEHMLPQLRDLVLRYQPALIYTDGEWDQPVEVWQGAQFLSWLFNQAPNRQEVAVNDRWGRGTRGGHGGYYTTEYGEVVPGAKLVDKDHPWEEIRGIGASFGYNRNEDLSDYRSAQELLHLLIEIVSEGGNLNLDIGPAADGTIPVIMQERLVEMGDWLAVNGEAIYGTHPWQVTTEGGRVRYTSRGDTLYAHCLEWPRAELVLGAAQPTPQTVVSLLGRPAPLPWRYEQGKLIIQVPPVWPGELPTRHAYVFKLSHVT